MLWWVVGVGVLVFFGPLLGHVVPPDLRYLVPRKRRAMRLALEAFAREHSDSQPDWRGCWVYQSDNDKSFVFIQHRGMIQPPTYAGYVIGREQEQPDRLGGWQFHWGALPRHTVDWYESQRAEKGGWPIGPVDLLGGD